MDKDPCQFRYHLKAFFQRRVAERINADDNDEPELSIPQEIADAAVEKLVSLAVMNSINVKAGIFPLREYRQLAILYFNEQMLVEEFIVTE